MYTPVHLRGILKAGNGIAPLEQREVLNMKYSYFSRKEVRIHLVLCIIRYLLLWLGWGVTVHSRLVFAD